MYIGRFVLEPLHTKSYTTDSSSCVHKDIHAHTHTQTHTHIYTVTTQNKYILQNISNRIWEGLLEIQLHGAAFFSSCVSFLFSSSQPNWVQRSNFFESSTFVQKRITYLQYARPYLRNRAHKFLIGIVFTSSKDASIIYFRFTSCLQNAKEPFPLMMNVLYINFSQK